MPTYLYIVNRVHPDLYEDLRKRFARDTNVSVILDRRLRPELRVTERGGLVIGRDTAERERERRSAVLLLVIARAFCG